jgi:hypothetical protein
MGKEWFEDHQGALGILLLLLAATNGWLAVFAEDPLTASANGTMAVVLVLGVIFCWHAGRRG